MCFCRLISNIIQLLQDLFFGVRFYLSLVPEARCLYVPLTNSPLRIPLCHQICSMKRDIDTAFVRESPVSIIQPSHRTVHGGGENTAPVELIQFIWSLFPSSLSFPASHFIIYLLLAPSITPTKPDKAPTHPLSSPAPHAPQGLPYRCSKTNTPPDLTPVPSPRKTPSSHGRDREWSK